jgi:chemotaxis protein MotB
LALAVVGFATPVDAIMTPLRAAPQNVVPLRQEPPATAPAVPAALAAREKLLESLRTSALGRRIELSADQDNVSLEISDNILFDPGSATLKQNGRQLLDELSVLLAAQDYTVSVEGHSDNVPFSNAHFASNWELSAGRATNVTRYLIAHGIAATRLRAIGYADTRPRADNASAQGKARNRRVALVLHMPAQAAPDLQSGNNQDR